MRRMSFNLTQEQVRNRAKTVTRRRGWQFAAAGDVLRAVDRLRSKQAKTLAFIEVVKISIEDLDELLSLRESDRYTEAEAAEEIHREGFDCTPAEFVAMFKKAMKHPHGATVTRIEFRYVEDDAVRAEARGAYV